MYLAQLRNELWKLFGKKRTYIGFGAFLLAQTLMLLAFKYTRWQGDFENCSMATVIWPRNSFPC